MHKNATFQLHQAQSLLVCLLVKHEVVVHERDLGVDADESLKELGLKVWFPLRLMRWLRFSKPTFSSKHQHITRKSQQPYINLQTL